MSKIQGFLKWEERSLDVIGVKRCYVNIAGDLATGVLLSQIVYWFLPSKKTGSPRVTIDREGRNWLAKKRDEWWEECCVTPKQFDRSIEILESLGIVTTALFKFSGSPTKHISLNFDRLIELIERGENGISPNSKNEVTERVNSNLPLREELITETTAETTQRLPEWDTVDTRILCESLGIHDIRQEEAMNRLYKAFTKTSQFSPEKARDHMKSRWELYKAKMPKLEWTFGGAYKFFMSGTWDNPDGWPKKKNIDGDTSAMKFAN